MKVVAIAGKARNGKTTVANIFKNIASDNGESSIIVSYAGYVKYICSTYYGWDGKKDEPGRTLLQSIGDGYREKYGKNYWIDRLVADIETLDGTYDYILIDDCRYPNEIILQKKMYDTYSVRVNREDFESDLSEEQKKHRSEVALDDFEFDYEISSLSGIEKLIQPTKELYDKIKNGDM